MKLADFVEGLLIIQQYEKSEYCLSAEHDQFWAGSENLPLSKKDAKRMEKLGWFNSEFDNWSAFV